MKLNNACSKICKLKFNDLNPIRWLFSDIKQSMEIADQYNLFEDLDITNVKIIKPSSKEIYPKYFAVLKKLCLLPMVIFIVEFVVDVIWIQITGLYIYREYSSIMSGLIPFVGIFYGVLMWLFFSGLAWKYNLIVLAVCPNLKYGEQIAFILRSYAKFWLKIFLAIMIIFSSISIFICHVPVAILSFLPSLFISSIITSIIFNMEQERSGLEVVFNNISLVINKLSRVS